MLSETVPICSGIKLGFVRADVSSRKHAEIAGLAMMASCQKVRGLWRTFCDQKYRWKKTKTLADGQANNRYNGL